jgi:hypothetical protein
VRQVEARHPQRPGDRVELEVLNRDAAAEQRLERQHVGRRRHEDVVDSEAVASAAIPGELPLVTMEMAPGLTKRPFDQRINAPN